jgi:hypothetical protein
MRDRDFPKKILNNIAPILLFVYAILILSLINFTDEISEASHYEFASIYAFIFALLSIGVYKKYKFAEVLAMLISAINVFVTIANLFGVEEFSSNFDSSTGALLLAAFVTLIHSIILISLFKIRYKRSQILTENFQTYYYPTRQKL